MKVVTAVVVTAVVVTEFSAMSVVVTAVVSPYTNLCSSYGYMHEA